MIKAAGIENVKCRTHPGIRGYDSGLKLLIRVDDSTSIPHAFLFDSLLTPYSNGERITPIFRIRLRILCP